MTCEGGEREEGKKEGCIVAGTMEIAVLAWSFR